MNLPAIGTGAVLGLLAVSSFFSGTETALFILANDRRAAGRSEDLDHRVRALLSRRHALLTTLLLGNVGANLALAIGGAVLVSRWWPGQSWLNVLVLTPIIVLVAEIMPKALATAWPRPWARAALPLLAVFGWIVAPIRIGYAAVVGWLARRLGADPDRWQIALGTADLLDLIGTGAASGALDEMEREIIEAVFELDDKTVERLMTPRTEMFSLPLTLPWDDLVKRCRESERARVPIHGSRNDDIVGVLLLKDLLKHRHAPPAGPRQLRSLLVPPMFVPASRPADSMLREFLEKQFQMAFVVDEHGTLLGLVTLDDLLQELMGEDEAMAPESAPEPRNGSWLLDGLTDVDDFRDATGVTLPAGEYHTLGGFVFYQLGRLPRRGDSVTWSGQSFVVREMDGRRISQVAIEPVTAQGAN